MNELFRLFFPYHISGIYVLRAGKCKASAAAKGERMKTKPIKVRVNNVCNKETDDTALRTLETRRSSWAISRPLG